GDLVTMPPHLSGVGNPEETSVNYYVAEGASQKGPLPAEELAQMGVAADALVWCEGMSQWQRADSVPALRPILRPAAATEFAPAQPGPFGPAAQPNPSVQYAT